MAHMNLQTSEKPKQQVSIIVLLLVPFLIFCGIILYHVWDLLLKSCSQKPIPMSRFLRSLHYHLVLMILNLLQLSIIQFTPLSVETNPTSM